VWKICFYLFGVWILRSALLRSTALNPVDHLEHLISKINWVNFEINSILPSLLLVFVEKVLTCLFTPPSRQLSVSSYSQHSSDTTSVTPGFKEQSQVHLIHAPKETTYIITECIEINITI
jgi:hypothetical protein